MQGRFLHVLRDLSCAPRSEQQVGLGTNETAWKTAGLGGIGNVFFCTFITDAKNPAPVVGIEA